MSCPSSVPRVRTTAHHVDCVCHSKIETTVGYLGIEVDDAIEVTEKDRNLIRDAILRSADVVGDGLRVADRQWAKVGFCMRLCENPAGVREP
jgi:hypothetical protein